MLKKHLINLNLNGKSKRQKTNFMNDDEQYFNYNKSIISILNKDKIKGWQRKMKLKGTLKDNISFSKQIKENDIKKGLTLIYDNLLNYALPTFTYPDFHREILSQYNGEDNSIKIHPIFKLASIALFFQPTRCSLRRSGGFKNIPMEPYLINLFHQAITNRNDGYMYCFIYMIISWMLFSTKININHLIQTPIDPSFQLYYRFVDLLEKTSNQSNDMNTIRCFLLFKKITDIKLSSLSILLNLFDTMKMFDDFLTRHHLDIDDMDEIEKLWVNCDYDVNTLKELHILFSEYPLVYRICNLLSNGHVFQADTKMSILNMANYLGDVTSDEIVHVLYNFFLSDSLSEECSYSLLKGFVLSDNYKPLKTYKQPKVCSNISKNYNIHTRIQGCLENVIFNPIYLETFLHQLEYTILFQHMEQQSTTQILSNIYETTFLYFSENINFPIHSTFTGEIFTLNETFFLPI